MNVTAFERTAIAGAAQDPLIADNLVALIEPQDFDTHDHRKLWAAITALARQRRTINIAVVASLAEQLGVPAAFTYEVVSEPTTAVHATHAAKHVLAASQLRALVLACATTQTAAQSAHPDPATPAQLIDELRAAIEGIENRSPSSGPIHIHASEPDLVPRILEDMPTPRGIRTGFTDLDWSLGGLRNGEMIVLAARPSVGKSLFAANIVEHVALADEEPHSALIFSMEMSASALYRRVLFGRSAVDADIALRGQADAAQKSALVEADREIRRMRCHLHCEPNITPQRMQSVARRYMAKHGPTLLVVDYLGLMRGEGRSTYEQVTNLSKAMKGIAVDLNCPNLVLAQLNRNAAEGRDRNGDTEIKIPTLGDLRDSGAIEQDADVVIFLARNVMARDTHPADLVIAKNRPGRTGKMQVQFDVRGPRFRDAVKVEKWTGQL